MTKLRALTVWQPWATALIWGGKNVENRPRQAHYRGPLWIHAGLHHPDWGDYLEVRALSGVVFDWTATRSASAEVLERAQRRTMDTAALGVILGSVDVTGCHHSGDCMLPSNSVPADTRPGCSPWAVRGQWHIEVTNARPLTEPVPCKGALGLWKLPEGAERAVTGQLEATHG